MNFQNQVDFGQEFGIDVLGGVQAPEPLSVDTLKSMIMIRCGLLTPLFSEPDTMASAIKVWFGANSYGISKMIELVKAEYLPLENYRRNETVSRTLDRKRGENETTTDSGTITDDYRNNNEKTVSAYNSEEYAPDEKNQADGNNERELDTERSRDLSENLADKENETRLVYGNIGTMTTQQMFNEELDLLARFNPYEWIVSKLEHDLFLALW